jgi:hypothetical protein
MSKLAALRLPALCGRALLSRFAVTDISARVLSRASEAQSRRDVPGISRNSGYAPNVTK